MLSSLIVIGLPRPVVNNEATCAVDCSAREKSSFSCRKLSIFLIEDKEIETGFPEAVENSEETDVFPRRVGSWAAASLMTDVLWVFVEGVGSINGSIGWRRGSGITSSLFCLGFWGRGWLGLKLSDSWYFLVGAIIYCISEEHISFSICFNIFTSSESNRILFPDGMDCSWREWEEELEAESLAGSIGSRSGPEEESKDVCLEGEEKVRFEFFEQLEGFLNGLESISWEDGITKGEEGSRVPTSGLESWMRVIFTGERTGWVEGRELVCRVGDSFEMIGSGSCAGGCWSNSLSKVDWEEGPGGFISSWENTSSFESMEISLFSTNMSCEMKE